MHSLTRTHTKSKVQYVFALSAKNALTLNILESNNPPRIFVNKPHLWAVLLNDALTWMKWGEPQANQLVCNQNELVLNLVGKIKVE